VCGAGIEGYVRSQTARVDSFPNGAATSFAAAITVAHGDVGMIVGLLPQAEGRMPHTAVL
jgi:hypothetical protein